MSKLKEKDLIEYFDDMCLFLANHHWTERDERAVAIREMIQTQPQVSEEFVKKWALLFVGIKSFKTFKEVEGQAKEIILEMFNELGVKVVGK